VNQGEFDTRFSRRKPLPPAIMAASGIEPCAAPDKWGEADGEQARAAANVEQGFVAVQGDLLKHFA